MEINKINTGAINAYKNTAVKAGKGQNPTKTEAAAENFDKIEFDSVKAVTKAKNDISADIVADASDERIAALRQAYGGGNTPTTPDDIAGYIVYA
ncbi:MAG: hypothetical protein LBN40_00455 [Oscillospiraceae bacterium]|jgi:anti-sigma28 factor (negative regulator of flagellin synthesis)|nr:hypothetical protein [Oscillospiraceae bacterium]